MYGTKDIRNCDNMSVFKCFQENHENEITSFREYQSMEELSVNENFALKINNANNYQCINQNYGQSTFLPDCESKTRVQNWLDGCEVLGFIPDQHSHANNILAQEFIPAPHLYDEQHNQAYGKPQHRSLSNTGKTACTTLKMKRKRKRTIFTTEQIISLEAIFQKKPYINREERAVIKDRLQVSEKSVKIWFQNRRRVTEEKYPNCISYSPTSEDVTDLEETLADKLTFIESQINDNTDEYGYVTLNESVINQLACIIDYYLPQDVDTGTNQLPCSKTNEVRVIYEPISPASVAESSEDTEANMTEYQDCYYGYY